MPVEAAVMAVVDRCEIDSSAFEGPRPLQLWRKGPRGLVVERIRTEGMPAPAGTERDRSEP
jgi:hypothetical protein